MELFSEIVKKYYYTFCDALAVVVKIKTIGYPC
jgi:hypothetical protein